MNKTKQELIAQLRQEDSIGCTLYLTGEEGDFPPDQFGETRFLVVFEDIDMWSNGRELNEQSINEVFDATIEKIVVELGRLSLTHNFCGICVDSTSKIYLSRSPDHSTNIDDELIDEIVALINRHRKSWLANEMIDNVLPCLI